MNGRNARAQRRKIGLNRYMSILVCKFSNFSCLFRVSTWGSNVSIDRVCNETRGFRVSCSHPCFKSYSSISRFTPYYLIGHLVACYRVSRSPTYLHLDFIGNKFTEPKTYLQRYLLRKLYTFSNFLHFSPLYRITFLL